MCNIKIRERKGFFLLIVLILISIPGPVLSSTFEEHLRMDTAKVDSLSMNLYNSPSKSFLIKYPKILSFKYTGGMVLKTNEAVKGDNSIPYAQYAEVKFGYSVLGNRWKDIAYGMPYYGIGVGFYDFNRSDFGRPVSAYLFYGARLYQFSQNVQLKYEWNLGVSFNWKTYDPVSNPRNESMGSPTNVYFAGNLYLNWILSRHWDLNVGLSINHVSNGATKMPNHGLNTVGAFVGLTYNFDRDRVLREYNPFLTVPEFRARFISDISVSATKRERRLDSSITRLSSDYIDHNFFVMNMSYALLHMPGYKYRYGLSVDGIYDESADFTARKAGETEDGDEIVDIDYGKTRNRFALGLSLRGDMVFPKFIVAVQAGYNVVHNNRYDKRFYQSLTVKVPFWQGMYGSFTVRSKALSKSQYILFGLGYTFEHKPHKKK